MKIFADKDALGFTNSAALGARLGELDHHRKRATEQILALERTGTIPAPLPDRPPKERREAALALLKSDAAILAAEGLTADAGARLAALHRLRTDLDEALRLGGQHSQTLAGTEYSARMGVHKREYQAIMREVAQCVIQLERLQQKRDTFIKEVLRPPSGNPIEGQAWPFLGRLRHREGQAYRFLNVAVAQEWLTAAELQRELQDAHKA